MKYIVRALKYFVHITLLVAVILALLVAAGFVSSDINIMFKHGWESVGMILLMFLAVSAFYPRFGYTRRGVIIRGPYEQIRPGVVSFMEERGYVLEKEEGEDLSFRLRTPLRRALKLWEDRITFTRDIAGFYVEGIAKDVVRIVSGLEFRLRTPEES